ncbi:MULTISPECIES: hypothetical protein [unclassified Bacillus cereus group]|uniref:hypothetical protein n=1 Tax=unclassified Bacillus cereus group TaxID=2750818 RepID=UPI001F58DF80|nr:MULTISPECIES: hypothetical protein [unclassified Bacillus cereus group]
MTNPIQILINKVASFLLFSLSILLFMGVITNQYVSFIGGILLGGYLVYFFGHILYL